MSQQVEHWAVRRGEQLAVARRSKTKFEPEVERIFRGSTSLSEYDKLDLGTESLEAAEREFLKGAAIALVSIYTNGLPEVKANEFVKALWTRKFWECQGDEWATEVTKRLEDAAAMHVYADALTKPIRP